MDKLYLSQQQLVQALRYPMIKLCHLLQLSQQRQSQELRDTRHNLMDKLYLYRQQLARALPCPTVKLSQLLQITKLLYSHLGPVRQVQLLRVSQRKVHLPLQALRHRTKLLLQDQLRPRWFLHLRNITARDPTPSHQSVMILRLLNQSQRASYTDHPPRHLRLRVTITDLRAFLPMSLRFFTKTVALARNLLIQG